MKNKLHDFAAAAVITASMGSTLGCAGVKSKPAVEYGEGILTVSTDKPEPVTSNRNKYRTDALKSLGANHEGIQDNTYVLCGNIAKPAGEQSLESILVDSLQKEMTRRLVLDTCGFKLNKDGTLHASPVKETPQPFAISQSAKIGDTVCLRTSLPSDFDCNSAK